MIPRLVFLLGVLFGGIAVGAALNGAWTVAGLATFDSIAALWLSGTLPEGLYAGRLR